jgi:hypothetical protein
VSDIKCRVLLTTPIEILDDGHTIILSRGLLNILPNDSAIPILLAYEIADMLFGKPGVSSENEESVWQKSLVMVDKAGYSKGVGYTSLLFAQLVQQSKHIPNLLRARFGLSLLDIAKGLPTTAVAAGSPTSLVLRGKYTIDAWGASLQVRYEHTNSIATESIPPF